nr:reverse transcriptase domain-containing protein [Tanacetum cinerariifolium]
MEELCQPTLNGQGGPISLIAIQAMNFGLKNDMIQQVQNSCQFHGLLGNDANKHLDKFLHVTQRIKVNGVIDDALRLYLLPHSLTHHATAWFDRLPKNSITPFEKMAKMFLRKYFPPSMPSLAKLRTYMLRELKIKVTNMTSLTNSNLELKNIFGQFMKMNTTSSSGSETLPNNIITNPKEDLKGNTTRSRNAYKGPTIPTTSSLPKVVERETEANDQKEKIFKIFQDLDFDIRFADALILMPKFFLTVKSLLTDKEKLFELARTPLNEHCSAVLLKKLPEKLGDPGKFLTPRHALIDVYEGELTFRVGKESVTFNLDQTLRYSANYDAMSVNRIDLIDVAYEEYSQEVLGFSMSGNPTPSKKPIVSNSSPTLTPFRDSDFLLEETDTFLAIDDEPISPKINDRYYDS